MIGSSCRRDLFLCFELQEPVLKKQPQELSSGSAALFKALRQESFNSNSAPLHTFMQHHRMSCAVLRQLISLLKMNIDQYSYRSVRVGRKPVLGVIRMAFAGTGLGVDQENKTAVASHPALCNSAPHPPPA